MLALLLFLACATTTTDTDAPTPAGVESVRCFDLRGDVEPAPIGSIPVVMECFDGYCWPGDWETSGGYLHISCTYEESYVWVRWL